MMYVQITFTDGSTRLIEAKLVRHSTPTHTVSIDRGEDLDADTILKMEVVFK